MPTWESSQICCSAQLWMLKLLIAHYSDLCNYLRVAIARVTKAAPAEDGARTRAPMWFAVAHYQALSPYSQRVHPFFQRMQINSSPTSVPIKSNHV